MEINLPSMQLLSGRLQLDIFPTALVRAHAQIDGRVVIEFITPACSLISIDLEQAEMLYNTLFTAIRDMKKWNTG
jgi:hypothetical protein